MRARANIRDFDSLQSLLVAKGFLSKTLHSPIGFSPFVTVLSGVNAPKKVIDFYAKLIQDPEERFETCLKAKVYDICVDTLIEIRDRQRLIAFRDQFLSKLDHMMGGILIAKINKILKGTEIKWK